MKVLAFCPNPNDATAYYRAVAPLAALRKAASDFSFTVVDKVNTNLLLDHDVLFLQRPCSGEHVNAMHSAHLLSRPVWCDWDDDILNVPTSNGRVFIYQNEKVKENVRLLAQAADVVTVTCEALAKRFRSVGAHNVQVIPNALDPSLDLPPANADRLAVRRVVWRGGDSHNQDMLSMGKAFPMVAQETEGEVLWHFMGMTPFWLLDAFPSQSAHAHPWIPDPLSYLRALAQLRPSVLAVPLVDDGFNRCKSNIAVLEAAWVGALPVAPKWLEGCDIDGVVTYENERDFERALRVAAKMPEAERLARLSALRAAVADKYHLPLVNLKRALVLKRLVKAINHEGTSTDDSLELAGRTSAPAQ